MNRTVIGLGASLIAAAALAAGTIISIGGGGSSSNDLAPGETRVMSCPNRIDAVRIDLRRMRLLCQGPAATQTSAPATATPTSPAPSPSPSRTPAPTNTSAPTPSATPTLSGGGAGCVTNCGTPRFFCDTPGGWAFCDDYRDLYCQSTDFTIMLTSCQFPDASRASGGRGVSANVLSATDPRYRPYADGRFTLPAGSNGWFFNQQEHFHSIVNDGNFGVAIARHHQPIDLSAERRIHFEVDLDVSARRYVRLLLSPEIVKKVTDDRDPPQEFAPNSALDIWFLNGHIFCSVYPGLPDGGACDSTGPRYYGANNVRDLIDVYVSRTRIRVLINGQQMISEELNGGALAFDRAYVYLVQADYNSCKDGECAVAQHQKHWDNFAFDGPVLAPNSIVPAGMQDVAFNAYGQAACRVKGVLAAPMGPAQGFTWVTWVARMPEQPVSPADVVCTNGEGGQFWSQTNRTPMDFEIVKR